VPVFADPIDWLLETLRLWRARKRRQTLDNLIPSELQDRALTAEDCRQLHTPPLLPPL
jgi:hypothetical protein